MRHRNVLLLVAILVTATSTYFITKNIDSTKELTPQGSSLQLAKLHESFTMLPCTQDTTLGIEGCQQRAILELDAKIDAERQVILGTIKTKTGKKNFVAAEQAWYDFRQANCLAKSDVYYGGSLATVTFGGCIVNLNKAHLADLADIKNSYAPL